MRNSKIIKSILFIFVLFLCSRLLTFLLYPVSSLNNHFINYHAQKENIDLLVLGSSLEGDGINASVMAEEFDQNAYILSPQGSYPESIYQLLVDCGHTHKLKKLVIGWDVLQNYENPPYAYPHEEELYREFYHDMKGNIELTKIVFKGVMNQRYTSTFFDWSSFPENITKIPEVLKSRKEGIKAVVSPKPIDEDNYEKSVYKYHQVTDFEYRTSMSPEDAEYMLKIKEYCSRSNIELFVISCPIPKLIMDARPELQKSIEDSYNFMKSNNIPYIHGNDQNFFPGSMETENFKDFFGHIISPYREIYTKAICDWIKTYNK